MGRVSTITITNNSSNRFKFLPTIRKQYPKDDTVDGRNPAPVDR